MTLQETIKSAVPRLQPYEIEALAVALEGAGYEQDIPCPHCGLTKIKHLCLATMEKPVISSEEVLAYLKSLPKDTPEPRVEK